MKASCSLLTSVGACALLIIPTTAHAAQVADNFRLPLDGPWTVSQGFGIHAPNDTTQDRYHLGQDVPKPSEVPVYAAANGTLKHNSWRTDFGYVVVIEHQLPDNSFICSVYGHLRQAGLAPLGDVTKGQVIGYLTSVQGDYGGIHLHFGIRTGAFSNDLDPDGQWRYRGYGPSSIMSQWLNPTNFVGPRLTPKFALGNRVVASGDLNVRSSAAGAAIGDQLAGAKGVIVAGPVPAMLQNTFYVWWQVDWDSGTDGWSFEDGLAKGGAEIRILTQSFTYAPGTPITIECMLVDESGLGVPDTTIFATDSLYRVYFLEDRLIGTTGSDGRFTLSYSGSLTQTLGPGLYPVLLVASKARTTFVINLSAPGPDLFTANTLRLNIGQVAGTTPLTAETRTFSPQLPSLSQSSVLFADAADRLEAGVKVAREAGIWLAQKEIAFFGNPANAGAAGLALLSCPAGGPVNPVCSGSLGFLLKNGIQDLLVETTRDLINISDEPAQWKRDAGAFLDLGDLMYSAFSLKPDGSLESRLDSVGTSWDVGEGDV